MFFTGLLSVAAKLMQDHVAPAAMRLSTNAGFKYFMDYHSSTKWMNENMTSLTIRLHARVKHL